MAETLTQKSTIVRANIGNQLRGAALAFAEREAPRLGARLAVRMWMTIPPPAPPVYGPAGERVVLRAEGKRKPSVVAESWGAGPPVYLLHGWAGHRGQFSAFTDPIAGAGFRVIAVDGLGHGESGPGRYGRGRGLMPDFISALEAAIAHYGPPHGLVAHSLGASAAAVAVLNGLPAGRLVLLAPIANALSGIDIFARIAGVGPRVRAQMPRRVERLTRLPMAHFDIVTRAAECDELPPALVIHDTADRTVPFDHGVLVASAWPGARLERTEGLGHRRMLMAPRVTEAAAGFLAGVAASGVPASGLGRSA